MSRPVAAAALAAGVLIGATGGATAAPLGPGEWTIFQHDAVGSAWERTFQFRVTGTALLKVVECCVTGDRFAVFNRDERLFDTSASTEPGISGPGGFEDLFADPRWSSGSALLGSGVYRIGGTVLATAPGFEEGGAGFLRVDAVEGSVSPVPLPAPAGLLAAALAGFGLLRLRRRD